MMRQYFVRTNNRAKAAVEGLKAYGEETTEQAVNKLLGTTADSFETKDYAVVLTCCEEIKSNDERSEVGYTVTILQSDAVEARVVH